MDINNITAVYFIGAGGIGMSALISFRKERRWAVTTRLLPV